MVDSLNSSTINIFILILLAHIITDFIFQPTTWVKHKKQFKIKSYLLYVHGLFTGIMAWLLMGRLELWWAAAFIALTHTFIDLWKTYKEPILKYFIIDQLAHLIVIMKTTYWIAIFNHWAFPPLDYILTTKFYLIILGYAIVIWPAGYIISMATEKWRKELPEEELDNKSLDDAGKWIGILERILVLTFVISSQFSAIGFLIAAKSILRFAEKQSTIRTEYVLIGTLMSFGIAVIIGMLIQLIIIFLI